MAKLLMIQIQPLPYAGTAYLNGALKSKNHNFVLYVSNNIKNILSKISDEKPDMIGFPCMSSIHKEILSISKKIKEKYNIPIILGGSHPTLFPEVIEDKSIDIICRGEGEFALIDLMDAIDKNEPYINIKNLWVKFDNKIYKNELRKLVEPLDDIPLIDWSCYNNKILENSPPIVFLIRGCPFSCSYCFNKSTRDLYNGLGKYVRYFSVERSILEIKQALNYFSKSPVLFTSDSFGIDIQWMDNLLKEYSKITKLPFVLLLRPELATKKCIDILCKYNCFSVAIGVESGSESIRKNILNRRYSNQDLIDLANELHKHNIKFRTYNMIGLPYESEKDIWETIDINIKMKTDFPRGAIFTPMPNTQIVDIAKNGGYLDNDFNFDSIPTSIFQTTILKDVDNNMIKNLLYFFQTLIIFPKSKFLIKRLIKMKSNILFKYWFYFVYAYLHMKSEKRALIPYIKYLFKNRNQV